MALIGALDALVSLSGALYVLLYLFGLRCFCLLKFRPLTAGAAEPIMKPR